MHIRTATNLDREDIRKVHLCAFPEDERSIVARLAVDLLAEKTSPQTISLVAEAEEAIVGHVAFSPLTFDNDEFMRGYILAPLGIMPDYQKRRIGSMLIEFGMQWLIKTNVDVLFVYGDPKYYSKFGFSVDFAESYIPPYKLQHPTGWQAVALNKSDIAKSPVKIQCVSALCDPGLW